MDDSHPANVGSAKLDDALEKVYTPDNILVDIVIVPGFLSTLRRLVQNEDYASIPSSPAHSKWPAELSAQRIPHARVFIYRYRNGDKAGFNDRRQFEFHAHRLLYHLALLRNDTKTPRKGIILVGCSLGGLVCKYALLLSKASVAFKFRSIFDLTIGVLFLGTPHSQTGIRLLLDFDLGNGVNEWVPRANSMPLTPMRAFKSISYPQRTQSLPRRDFDIGVLQEVQSNFIALLRSRKRVGRAIAIESFYETKKTNFLGFVLSRQHATLEGYPSTALDENHSSMIKFAEFSDTELEKVMSSLEVLTDNFERASMALDPLVRRAWSGERQALLGQCLESLAFPDFQRRHNPLPLKGTCEWIFDDPIFREWTASEFLDEPQGLLWIHGKPGCGKSTLINHLISSYERETSSDSAMCLSFFFKAHGEDLKRSRTGLYRALTHQLLSKVPSLLDDFIELFSKKRLPSSFSENIDHPWTSLELSGFFHSALAKSSAIGNQVCIFIDGIDECNEEELQPLLLDLENSMGLARSWGDGVRICCSGRKTSHLTIRTALEIQVDSKISQDLAFYIDQTMPHLEQGITGLLLQKAQGTFLWLALTLRILMRKQESDTSALQIEEIVRNFPLELSSLYESMLANIDVKERTFASRILQWVLFARELVELDVIFSALSYQFSPDMLPDGRHIEYESFGTQIRDHCRGLVELEPQEGTIHFVHMSVAEFLRSDTSAQLLDFSSAKEFKNSGHGFIAQSGIKFLASQSPNFVHSRPQPSHIFGKDGLEGALRKRSDDLKEPGNTFSDYVLLHTFEHMEQGSMFSTSSLGEDNFPMTIHGRRKILEDWLNCYLGKYLKNRLQTPFAPNPFNTALKPVARHREFFDLTRTELLLKSVEDDSLPRAENRKCRLSDVREGLLEDFALLDGPAKDHGRNVGSVNIIVGWQVASFMSRSFTTLPPLSDVFVLNGTADLVQGFTCAEYITEKWPSHATELLHFLDRGLVHILETGTEYSSYYELPNPIGPVNVHISWKGPGKLSEAERLNVTAYGPHESLAEVVECLAWLACAVRHPDVGEGIKMSDAYIDVSRIETELYCTISPNLLTDIEQSAKLCWHKCIKDGVIATGSPINPSTRVSIRQSLWEKLNWFRRVPNTLTTGKGLEVSLERLVLLSETTPVDVEGGMILLGKNSLLFPVSKLADGSYQWHSLHSEEESLISVSCLQESSANDSMAEQRDRLIISWKELKQSRRHFLGLWTVADVMLGTEEATRVEVQQASLKEKAWDLICTGFSALLGTPGMGFASFTAVTNTAFAPTLLRSGGQEPQNIHPLYLLEQFKDRQMILYDPHPDEQRAWLVPALSVVLHIIHLWVRDKRLTYIPPFAEASPDGNDAAYNVLLEHGDDPVTAIGKRDESKLYLSELLRQILMNIRRMDFRSSHAWVHIEGYHFADLVQDLDSKLVRKRILPSSSNCRGWTCLTKKVPVLICRGLGELMRPRGRCQDHPPFEKGQDLLVASMRGLKAVSKGKLDDGYIADNVALHCPLHPFQDQEYVDDAAKSKKDWIQFLIDPSYHRHHCPKGLSSNYPDSAVMLGGYPGKKLKKEP